MANVSRVRSDPSSWPFPTDQTEAATNKQVFHYTPLDQKVEEFRLLVLHPKRTDSSDEPIHCSLCHTTFGKRPTYEALSYTWGDQSSRYEGDVKVNGISFPISQNLGCALAQLRLQKSNRNLWVDAICINQNDKQEKSSQIPLMTFIYMRAQKCLIWLMPRIGVSTENYEEMSKWVQRPGLPLFPSNEFSLNAVSFLHEILDNGYWRRVWIIQEIGSARKIEILCLNIIFSWHNFITRLKSVPGLASCVPLKLQQQIDDKYSAGHRLQHLIESHQSSLCEDPRDHIYGFVGLANDAQDFPIDYSKSVYEVWKDVILFNQSDRSRTQEGVITYARLVKELLGVTAALEGRTLEFESTTQLEIDEKQTMKRSDADLITPTQMKQRVLIPSRVSGHILHVGPCWTDMIAFPRKTVDWKLSINRNVAESDCPRVRKESDLFLRKLELYEEGSFKGVKSFNNAVPWEESDAIKEEPIKPNPRKCWPGHELPFEDVETLMRHGFPEDHTNEPRLFLMDYVGYLSETDMCNTASVGLVPHGAFTGDLICQINGSAQAFIVRRCKDQFKLIGTAVLSNLYKGLFGDPPFQTARFDSLQKDNELNLCIEASVLYELVTETKGGLLVEY